MKHAVLAGLVIVAATPAALHGQLPDRTRAIRYAVDPAHTSVVFSVTHLGLSKVRGTARVQSGVIMYTPGRPSESTVTIVLDMTTLDTGNDRRDEDLRDNYFRTAQNPRAIFRSSEIVETASGLRVAGMLAIAGTEGPVVLAVGPTVTWQSPDGTVDRLAWEGSTRIARRDFGVENPGSVTEATGVIGAEVDLDIQIEAVRTDPSSIAYADGEPRSIGLRFEDLLAGSDALSAVRALARELTATPEQFNASAREFLVLASRLMSRSEGSAAMEVLATATALHPENARLWELQAENHWRGGRSEEAARAAERASQLDPGSALALEVLRLTRRG